MDRNREHIGPFVEDTLRAVAVMDIDVEDRHALVLQAQMGGPNRAIDEKRKTAGNIAIGVMARRAAERASRILAVHDELAAVVATSVAAQAAAQVPGPIGQPVSAVCQPRRSTIWVG
jgi:hypothetical protein